MDRRRNKTLRTVLLKVLLPLATINALVTAIVVVA